MLSEADAEIIARDSHIPALGLLLDPDAAAETIARVYPEARIEEVSPRYLRYKPGTSCLAAYSVETATGVVPVYARAHNPQLNDKAGRAAEGDDAMSGLGGGIRVVAGSSLVFFPFPNDHELPALRALAEKATREAMLRETFRVETCLWSGEVHTVRYKPERRLVARLRAQPGSGAALKFYRRDDYESVRDMTDVFDSVAPLCVPRRLARSKRYRLSAVEWLDGPTVHEALAQGAAQEAAWNTVGSAIARLHGQKSSKLRVMQTAESYVESLRRAAASVGEIAPRLATQAESVAKRIGDKLLKRHWRTRRAIHGDLSAEQIILLPAGAAVVDFDRASYGDPRIDLGTFAARLIYDAEMGFIDREVGAACEHAVIEAYREASDKDITRKVDRFTAASLLLMAIEPFRHREPDWRCRIEAILGRAESLVSGERTGAA